MAAKRIHVIRTSKAVEDEPRCHRNDDRTTFGCTIYYGMKLLGLRILSATQASLADRMGKLFQAGVHYGVSGTYQFIQDGVMRMNPEA